MEGLKDLLQGRKRLMLMCFAILWIVGFHYSMYGNLLRFNVFEFLFGKGYLGVDIFFFLSAYGLCHSLTAHSLKEFYVRRLKRLYPLYLLYLLLFLGLFSKGYDVPWYKVLLFQTTGLMSFTNIDIEWFVPALTVLYITFPLVFKAIEAIYKRGVLFSAIIVAALSILNPFLNGFVFYLFPPRFVIIVVGIMTYLAIRDDNEKYLLTIYSLCAVLGLCYIGSDKINVSQTGSLILPALLYVIGMINIKVPSIKAIDFIGSHTLEIYLAQNLAFNHLISVLPFPFYANSIVAFGLVVVCSALLILFQKIFYASVAKSIKNA